MKENGIEDNPRKITEDDVNFLLEEWAPLAISTKNWYLHIFNRYLKYHKNEVVEEMGIELGYDDRPNVDWLSDEECDILLYAGLTPLERTTIHLELCMGLRVSEVVKLKIEDIHYSEDPSKCYMSVLGKGKGVGKWRPIPFHPNTKEVFDEWLERRSEMVAKIRAYDPRWRDPGTLLIWSHYVDKPTGGPYTERGHSLDRAVIHKVRDRLGFNFKNHTLRRTFGRNLYHANVPIETISKLYGHDNIKTTLDYIGINLEDMGDALSKLYLHQLGIAKKGKGCESK